MNPISILGSQWRDVESRLDHAGVRPVFDELEECEEQSYSASARDGSWEVSLGEGHRIETVFLYAQRGAALPFSFRPDSRRADVLAALGRPDRSGEESDGVLGVQGPWDRYDTKDYSLHVQYTVGGEGIALVTVMLPDVAP